MVKFILEMMKCQIANLSSFCLGLLQSLSWRLARLGTLESIVSQQFYFVSAHWEIFLISAQEIPSSESDPLDSWLKMQERAQPSALSNNDDYNCLCSAVCNIDILMSVNKD